MQAFLKGITDLPIHACTCCPALTGRSGLDTLATSCPTTDSNMVTLLLVGNSPRPLALLCNSVLCLKAFQYYPGYHQITWVHGFRQFTINLHLVCFLLLQFLQKVQLNLQKVHLFCINAHLLFHEAHSIHQCVHLYLHTVTLFFKEFTPGTI